MHFTDAFERNCLSFFSRACLDCQWMVFFGARTLATLFSFLLSCNNSSLLLTSSFSATSQRRWKELLDMTDNGIVIDLEKHVDTDFAVGELNPPASVTSAATSEGADDSSACQQPMNVPKIVAAGKGSAMYLPAILSKVVELSGKEAPNILYIGTASFDKEKNYKRYYNEFTKRLGSPVKRLNVSEPDDVPSMEEMRHLVVEWADVIACSGGNTLHALVRWQETGLDMLMKEAAELGTVLCGGSAGAGCWFSSMHSDSLRPDNVKNAQAVKDELDEDELMDWDYVKINGLGIVPMQAMAVPHFDVTGTNDVSRSEHAEQVLVDQQEGMPAIGIDENAALVVEGDKAMVVSGDGKATVHVVVADEETGETLTAPLVPTEEPVPLEELVDIVNPATAGHLETLEEHVDTDFAIAEHVLKPSTADTHATAESSLQSNEQAIHGQREEDQVPKIVAAGRMKALQMPAVFEKVIELSGKEKPRICYIGTASFDRTDKYNLCTKAFRELDCEIERLDVSEADTVPSLEDMRRLVLDWADVLLCSGGNTLHALLRWKETGLDLILKDAAEQGKVLCGGSAGAGCWFSSIHSDSLRPDNVRNAESVKYELDDEDLTNWDYVKISGLGIIPAMAVPHFDATGTNDVSRSENAEHVLVDQQDGMPAIGIDENAALVVEGGKAMVVSGDGKATCHVVVADEKTGETSTAPLVPTEEPVPLEELVDIVNPATASHLETLEEHVDTDFAIAENVLKSSTGDAHSAAESSLQSEEQAIHGQHDEDQVPKIVAAGRMKALQLPAVFEKVIELSGKEKPRICYIGTASFDRTDKYNLCTKAFRDLDCEIERLDVSEADTVPSLEDMRRLVLDWADVLLCSGGNTLHALLRWKETGLDLILKDAAEQGKVLCGGSAGAGCWFSSIHSDSLRPDNVRNAESVKYDLDDEDLTNWDYVKISGLGIIPAMAVPHFDATGTNDVSRSEHAEQVLVDQQDGMPAIGIDENAALVVEGGKAMVVSGDGKATCHVVVADSETGETLTSPLMHGEAPAALEEMIGMVDFTI